MPPAAWCTDIQPSVPAILACGIVTVVPFTLLTSPMLASHAETLLPRPPALLSAVPESVVFSAARPEPWARSFSYAAVVVSPCAPEPAPREPEPPLKAWQANGMRSASRSSEIRPPMIQPRGLLRSDRSSPGILGPCSSLTRVYLPVDIRRQYRALGRCSTAEEGLRCDHPRLHRSSLGYALRYRRASAR